MTHSPRSHAKSGKRARKVSNRQRWFFRLLLMLVVPVLILGTAEIFLRVSGYGYPTSFFLEHSIEGEDYLIPNNKFGHRFFPSKLARTPVLYRFPSSKPLGTYRIFIFGASAALGDPDPSYSFGSYLKEMLAARYPSTTFEIINTGITAINSHAVLPIARECAQLEGDMWIIYLGNNEMVGPFGAGTVFTSKAIPLPLIRMGLFLKSTRLGQLMQSVFSRRASGSEAAEQWTGLNLFTENQLKHDAPEREAVYHNFQTNLRDILSIARTSEIPVILSTVGSNLRNCAPFASSHGEGLTSAAEIPWTSAFTEGKQRERAGQVTAALEQYEAAASLDPEFAELQFRIGRCQLALGNGAAAIESLKKARDYDTLSVRASGRINDILRIIAEEQSDFVTGLDAAQLLTEAQPQGISGQELFYEHVHLTPQGNYRLAKLVADAIAGVLPPALLRETTPWLGKQACDEALALTTWDKLRLWHEMAGRMEKPPFSSQSSHMENLGFIRDQITLIHSGITGSTASADRTLYAEALVREPDNTLRVGNYAQFLDGTGDKAASISQAEAFLQLLPEVAWTHYYLGALLAQDDQLERAEQSLRQALQLEPDLTPAQATLLAIEQRRQRPPTGPRQP